ncbi:MAG: glycerophosphodiester phosphodiesterase [Dehalococcoidia bacterium]|nr:glycerophosphodiester phosphodiesterase [Dehalococcoidia bacterium]
MARAVRRLDAAARCWVWAFDPEVGREARRALPEVPVALNMDRGSVGRFGYDSPLEECLRSGFVAVSLDHRMVTRELVSEAHARGLLVFTWTVDDAADIERMFEAGVDGVCGNYPPRIHAVIEARRALS